MWPTTSEHELQSFARIDLTPVIGVLAALLVLVMLQMPADTGVLKMPMPQVNVIPLDGGPQPIELRMDLAGTMTWSGIELLPGEFDAHLAALDRQGRHPELDLSAPPQLKYEHLADVAAAAQRYHFSLGLGRM